MKRPWKWKLIALSAVVALVAFVPRWNAGVSDGGIIVSCFVARWTWGTAFLNKDGVAAVVGGTNGFYEFSGWRWGFSSQYRADLEAAERARSVPLAL
jgi:hypothetical protein